MSTQNSSSPLPLHLVHAAGSPMVAVLAAARRIGSSGSSAVIIGASGTGKEILARLLHASGSTSEGRFTAIQCRVSDADAIVDILSESRAAGATEQRETIYLDDVGELSIPAQARLVRALDAAAGPRVRVIAGTTRDLIGDVAAGRFLRALFDLLACPLRVPPLRDRRDDVLAIFDHCWGELRPGGTLSPGARSLLAGYAWPGNVREVQAVSHRLAASATGPAVSRRDVERAVLAGTFDSEWIGETDESEHGGEPSSIAAFPALRRLSRGDDTPIDLNALMRQVEGELLRWALERSGGCKTTAARTLGLRRTTFSDKLKRLADDRVEPGEHLRRRLIADREDHSQGEP